MLKRLGYWKTVTRISFIAVFSFSITFFDLKRIAQPLISRKHGIILYFVRRASPKEKVLFFFVVVSYIISVYDSACVDCYSMIYAVTPSAMPHARRAAQMSRRNYQKRYGGVRKRVADTHQKNKRTPCTFVASVFCFRNKITARKSHKLRRSRTFPVGDTRGNEEYARKRYARTVRPNVRRAAGTRRTAVVLAAAWLSCQRPHGHVWPRLFFFSSRSVTSDEPCVKLSYASAGPNEFNSHETEKKKSENFKWLEKVRKSPGRFEMFTTSRRGSYEYSAEIKNDPIANAPTGKKFATRNPSPESKAGVLFPVKKIVFGQEVTVRPSRWNQQLRYGQNIKWKNHRKTRSVFFLSEFYSAGVVDH